MCTIAVYQLPLAHISIWQSQHLPSYTRHIFQPIHPDLELYTRRLCQREGQLPYQPKQSTITEK